MGDDFPDLLNPASFEGKAPITQQAVDRTTAFDIPRERHDRAVYENDNDLPMGYAQPDTWFRITAAQQGENALKHCDFLPSLMTSAGVSEAKQPAPYWFAERQL